MSKRHQSSRRRSYGRRQHEVRERTEHQVPDQEHELSHEREEPGGDGYSLFDLRAPGARLRFAVGD
jgi:hypothetical protein